MSWRPVNGTEDLEKWGNTLKARFRGETSRSVTPEESQKVFVVLHQSAAAAAPIRLTFSNWRMSKRAGSSGLSPRSVASCLVTRFR